MKTHRAGTRLPLAPMDAANARGIRKPPNAPIAPAIPRQPAAALRALSRPDGESSRAVARNTAGIMR